MLTKSSPGLFVIISWEEIWNKRNSRIRAYLTIWRDKCLKFFKPGINETQKHTIFVNWAVIDSQVIIRAEFPPVLTQYGWSHRRNSILIVILDTKIQRGQLQLDSENEDDRT